MTDTAGKVSDAVKLLRYPAEVWQAELMFRGVYLLDFILLYFI